MDPIGELSYTHDFNTLLAICFINPCRLREYPLSTSATTRRSISRRLPCRRQRPSHRHYNQSQPRTLRLSTILFPRKKIPISQIIYFLKCNPYVPLFVFRSVGSQKGGKLHLHTPIGAHFFRLLATGFDGVFKY